MEEKKKQRNDRILIIGIIVCAVLLTAFFLLKGGSSGTTVIVTVSGEEYGRYSLLQEQVIQINDTNTLVIHGGTADMLFAECPDQVCVKHTPISATSETIICLPNQVVVTIEELLGKKEETEVDAVVK